MSIRIIVCSTMFAALTLPTSSLFAGETEKKFEYLDSDGNGFISRSEATSNVNLRQRWNDVDKNKDGKLSAEEFAKFANAPTEPYSE